jgi:hypothetical protein
MSARSAVRSDGTAAMRRARVWVFTVRILDLENGAPFVGECVT